MFDSQKIILIFNFAVFLYAIRRRLNLLDYRGKNAIIIPQGGYSMQNRVGHVLYDAQANAGFEKGVRNTAAETVECITTPAHINDPACIDLIVQVLNRYMKGTF